MVGETVRRLAFWGIDFIKGSIIKKNINDIDEKNKGLEFMNYEQLEQLLKHANKTVPYYRNIKAGNIEEYPILTKQDFKDNYKDFQSLRFTNEKLHKMSTSGSTGTPFTILQDMNKRKRTIADLIYFNEIAGQRLGDRYMYIKAFSTPKSSLEKFKQNVVAIDILNLDSEKLEKIRSLLKKDNSIKSILAYASTYEQLANYLYKLNDDPKMFNIDAIFSSSAVISQDTKEKLTKIFDCPIIDRYSNQENGVLAQTRDTYGEFHINKASYFIELLNLDNNEPVGKGKLGRIVVTDLYNFAMPMIRYDTGDLAISDDNDRENLNTLRNIQGRRVDIIYDTKGNIMTPHTWSVHMRKYQKLKQWQFIQEDKNKYLLKVNGGEGIYTMENFDNELRSILGSDAEIEIEYVDEIPVLKSGKFKNTICNYEPNKRIE